MSEKDIYYGVYSYLLVCRESKADFLELSYDKIQKALRVSD